MLEKIWNWKKTKEQPDSLPKKFFKNSREHFGLNGTYIEYTYEEYPVRYNKFRGEEPYWLAWEKETNRPLIEYGKKFKTAEEVKNYIDALEDKNKKLEPGIQTDDVFKIEENNEAKEERIEISPAVSENISQIDEIVRLKQEEAKIKLENSPYKGKILNGLKSWENYGVEQKDKEGKVVVEGSFWKRMTKMTVNLALIGAISTVSIDQLAKHGMATATTLGGGIAIPFVKKMAMGLGMGTMLDLVGRKVPPKVKKWMPLALGIAGAGVSTVLTGGIAGGIALGSAGLGYLSTKYIKGNFTEEKIEERQKRAIEKLKEKYKDKILDEKEVIRFGEECTKLLKKSENMKIWGKGLDEATKILAGSAVAGIALEVSGLHQDSINNHQAEIKVQHELEAKIQHDTEVKAQQEIEAKIKHDMEMKAQHDTAHMQDITVHKSEGIQHSFIRQIEGNPDLAKELGYKGDLNDVKALHEFAGREAHIIAIKVGYVDNAGHEIRITEADKVGYEIKTESGHIVVEEKSIDGKILDTHHEGEKFGENLNKGEYIIKTP